MKYTYLAITVVVLFTVSQVSATGPSLQGHPEWMIGYILAYLPGDEVQGWHKAVELEYVEGVKNNSWPTEPFNYTGGWDSAEKESACMLVDQYPVSDAYTYSEYDGDC